MIYTNEIKTTEASCMIFNNKIYNDQADYIENLYSEHFIAKKG